MNLKENQYRRIEKLLPTQRGNVADPQAVRLLLETLGKQETTVDLLMDRVCQNDKTRFTAWGLKFNLLYRPRVTG